MISEVEVTKAPARHLKLCGFDSEWVYAGRRGLDIDARHCVRRAGKC